MARAFGSTANNNDRSTEGNPGGAKLPAGFHFVDAGVVSGESASSGIGDGDERTEPIGDGFVDPANLDSSGGTGGSDSAGGRTGKKRGRKPGSKNGTSSRSSSKTSDALTKLLYSVHMMGGLILKTPELMLTEEETKALSTAISQVSELYDVPMLDEKTLAWINLAMVAVPIYATRGIAIAAKAKGRNRKNITAVPIRPNVSQDFTSGSAGVM